MKGLMKWFLLLLALLVIGTCVYGYVNNPAGCGKLGSDLSADFPAIATDVTTIFTSTNAPPGAPQPALAAVAAPSPVANAPVASAPAVTPAPPPTPAGWTPPATIPAQPDWTWTTSQGVFKNVHIIKVEADCVTILHAGGQALVAIYELPPDLQKQLNYNPAAAIAAAAARKNSGGAMDASSPSNAAPTIQPANAEVSQGAGFPARFGNSLVVLQGSDLKPFDTSHLKNVKYWAFYYSASWCPPCRAFTPKLVQFYATFKAQHPNFELIFVNDDRSEDDMLAYMKSDGMAWPAVRFSDIDSVNGKQYCGSGIPDLVLVNSDGKILSDSFNGSEYVGPEKVMDDIGRMVTN